ncbi:MAG: DUF499 domain-containing protein [Chloroflexota bacterium]
MTTPWHQLCTLRDDVRSDTLRLDEFAADLNDVRTGAAPAVYREPGMLFDRTYPTYRMKVLARDVLRRVAGQPGRPVLRLQVAYGGGKTHTLITLLHLAERGAILAEHRTVQEFMTFAGLSELPAARVALLPGDKLDVKKGLEVYGPTGQVKTVRTLWGALAYQLAGEAGYSHLQSHDEEFTVPAEPLLVDLLKVPLKDGLGALVLVDEAVWYYRSAVNHNPRALGMIKDFYQVLTQAVSKVERAAMVASLIASKVEANDQTGTQCLVALDEVFQRIAEPVEPVAREDVAEVLRRRLFERTPGDTERRPAVDAVMAALPRLPLRETQYDQTAYDRWLTSYPFHPDLIDVLYQKWTQMSGFQRTRGALRLLAYALRDAEGHDPSAFVGPTTLLNYQSEPGLSSALAELVEICDESHKWRSILTGELAKAREIQVGLPTLTTREVEQAVISAFLHSQPQGQRAAPADLFVLLVHPLVDAAALEEGLRKWRQLSWFLVEDTGNWQLSTTPNLTHMHLQAKGWLDDSEIEQELEKRVRAVPALKEADSVVEVHVLPPRPDRIEDNLQLHYLILGPDCAIELGKPLPETVEGYFNIITGPDNPRIYRNNIIALAPEFSSVAGLREQVRTWLAWNRLEQSDLFKLMTDRQKKQLPIEKKNALNNLPEAVVGAYRILVAVDETGQVQPQTLRADSSVGGHPFDRIKAMLADEERLVTTTLDPDLILPDSYLALWGADQTSRRAADLMAAFGQFPRLPRLLSPESLYDTLVRGVREGSLILRLPRADGSARTWWRIPPDADTLRRKEMEVQPINLAQLHNLEPDLLAPGQIESLWPTGSNLLKLGQLQTFFDGSRAPRLASPEVLSESIEVAVKLGKVMVRFPDGYTLYREELPAGPWPTELELLPPPKPLYGADLTPQTLPQVWQGGQANLRQMAETLSGQRGYTLPWSLLRRAVDEALNLRLFEHDPDSGPWPCSPTTTDQVRFRLVEEIELAPETIISAIEYAGSKTPTLKEIKETIERQFFGGRQVPLDLFQSQVKVAIQQGKLKPVEAGVYPEPDEWVEIESLTGQVRLPDIALYAESALDAAALQNLVERIPDLITIAPELIFSFRLALTVEGQKPDEEIMRQLNALLDAVKPGWKLG